MSLSGPKLTWLENFNDGGLLREQIDSFEHFGVAAATQLRQQLVVVLVVEFHLRILVVAIVPGLVGWLRLLEVSDGVEIDLWQELGRDLNLGRHTFL